MNWDWVSCGAFCSIRILICVFRTIPFMFFPAPSSTFKIHNYYPSIFPHHMNEIPTVITLRLLELLNLVDPQVAYQ